MVRVTGDVLPTQRPTISQEDDDEDEVEQPVEETRIAQEIGTFDEVMVWNHDVPWDGAEDSYARGISEWMTFANAVSSFINSNAEAYTDGDCRYMLLRSQNPTNPRQAKGSPDANRYGQDSTTEMISSSYCSSLSSLIS